MPSPTPAQTTARFREQALRRVIAETADKRGLANLQAMAHALAEVTGADFSFIGELLPSRSVRTIALSHQGKLLENFDYPLDGTPCDDALSLHSCIYPEGITDLYPADRLLVDMGIVGYAGTAIFNAKREPAGIIVSLYRSPLEDTDFVKSIFEIFAVSIGQEMDRMRYENRIEQQNRAYATLNEKLVRANEELFRAKEKAIEANRAKDAFLAVLSHEMKTPLNPIQGFASLLREEIHDPQHHEYLDTIIASSQKLSSIIDDLLTFAQLRKSGASIAKRPFSPLLLAQELLAAMEGKSRGKSLRLENGRSRDLAPIRENRMTDSDASSIQQILGHLLDNACKYTKEGQVTLRVGEAEARGKLPSRLRFEVDDEGIGIPEHLRAKLFEPFFQADSSYARAYDGVGLGLSISTELSKALGGQIGFEPRQPKGSRFWLEIPLAAPSEEPLEDAPAAKQRSSFPPRFNKPYRLLVVEDNPDNAKYLETCLRLLGAQPTLARDGHQALALFKPQAFDLILMDLTMPGIDGIATARRLRAMAPQESPPIIALTANTTKLARANALNAGMVAFVTKPVRLDELHATITDTLANEP